MHCNLIKLTIQVKASVKGQAKTRTCVMNRTWGNISGKQAWRLDNLKRSSRKMWKKLPKLQELLMRNLVKENGVKRWWDGWAMNFFLCWAMALGYSGGIYNPAEVLRGEGSSPLLPCSEIQLLVLLQLFFPFVVLKSAQTHAVSSITCRVHQQHSDTGDSAVLCLWVLGRHIYLIQVLVQVEDRMDMMCSNSRTL